jgi:alanine racemase
MTETAAPPVPTSLEDGLPLPIRAEVRLAALRHNVRVLREQAGRVPLMGVVKADAYGHGVELVVPVLREEGVKIFAVANVPEAIRLRALGVTEPVLVFGAPLPEYLPAYERHDLDVAVTSREAAEAVLAYGGPMRVHVKVDTGMHRLGLAPGEAPSVLARLQAAPHVAVVGLWTHFATADEDDPSFAREQAARLDALLAGVDDTVMVHLANSGALAQVPEAVAGRALVRPGGALYGIPSSRAVAEGLDLEPVMRLVSRVVHLHTVDSGETVSYGRTWRASRPTRIATVAAGYADGLPRALSNRGEVSVRGRRFRVAGRVCMDMLMLDLGPPHGPGAEVEVGDAAVLFGPGGPGVLEVAGWAETITYALTAGLTARVPRVPV